jgi:hypothetical protein
VTECALIVGKPIENSLPDDRHHDLDSVRVTDLGPEDRVGVLDGADDQNASHSTILPEAVARLNSPRAAPGV